jgi:hypothetical protein
LKATQYRQKIYAGKNQIDREFKVGEHVLLKVNPKKRSLKLGSCTKLEARLCGPFEILDKIGQVAYILSLPASMNVHNVFHVSLLKKCVHDHSHVIDWHLIQVEIEGYFQVHPVWVLDIKFKILRNQVIELVKVLWTCYGPEDATWEHERCHAGRVPMDFLINFEISISILYMH